MLSKLPIQEYFDKHKDFAKMKGGLKIMGGQEHLDIMTYVICQAKVPDLLSQLELMTAFSSDYMQEGQDCRMS